MSGRGVERLLDLMEWLADHPGPVSLNALSKALGAPKSSLLEMLRTLVERGYLSRDGEGEYLLQRLPGQVYPGAGARLSASALLTLSQPFVEAAVAQARESGFVAVLENGMIRYLNKVLPDVEIQYNRDIRPVRQAHRVASGIVMLAFSPKAEVEAYLAEAGLQDEEKAALLEKLEQARRDGVWFNPAGVVEGAAGVAAPIFGAGGEVIAAFNVSGPKQRLTEALPHVREACMTAARNISEAIRKRG